MYYKGLGNELCGGPQDVCSNDYHFHSILFSYVFPFDYVVECIFRGVGSGLGKDRATWCDLSIQGDCGCSLGWPFGSLP